MSGENVELARRVVEWFNAGEADALWHIDGCRWERAVRA